MYEAHQDFIFKEFINFGVQLVESYEVSGNKTSGQEEKVLLENDLESDGAIQEKVMVEVKDEIITD